ncbi:hypothetical protein QQ045_022289 [Rhodiola kirilowii]
MHVHQNGMLHCRLDTISGHCPYYFIKIRLVGNKEFFPSETLKDTFPSSDELVKLTTRTIKMIVEEIISITRESKVKVNYYNLHCIITSWIPALINAEDKAKIITFEDKFRQMTIEVAPITLADFQKEVYPMFEKHDNFQQEDNISSSGSSTKAKKVKSASISRTPCVPLIALTDKATFGGKEDEASRGHFRPL